MIKAVIFDWGDTLMRDFAEEAGPMAFWSKVEVIDGVEEALKYLKSKNKILCVASNAGISDTNLMKMALKRGKIDSYFDFFFTSSEIGYKKPDPRFFLHICQKLNLLPFECLMIGNELNKDILGAKTAGLQTIWFNEKNIKSDENVITISNMKEIINHKIFNYE